MLQGTGKKKNYFEGWYFKMVALNGSAVMSVIPGIALSKDGNVRQAFIQVINGITAQTSYFVFPMEEFSHSPKEFSLTIGNNYFSKERIILDLKDDTSTVTGTVEMHNLVEYDSGSWFNPGIMGWYRYVPFMECYHGVVSLTHDLSGRLSALHPHWCIKWTMDCTDELALLQRLADKPMWMCITNRPVMLIPIR